MAKLTGSQTRIDAPRRSDRLFCASKMANAVEKERRIGLGKIFTRAGL